MSGPLSPEIREAFVERCRREWKAAGLPPTIEDPATLARVAALVSRTGNDTTTGSKSQNAR